MPSTPDSRNDPHNVIAIAPDIVLVAHAAAEFPSLAPDAQDRLTERQLKLGSGFADAPVPPKVDTSFRATDTSGGRSRSAWTRKVSVAFLFALCSAVAAAAWQRYGDDAQATVSGITPQIMPALASWLPKQKPVTPTQVDTDVATATAAVSPATPQPAAAAAQPADNTAAAAATPVAVTNDQLELLQSVARDVASLRQQIDELKATVTQLKAGQEQLSRDKARPSEARVSEVRPVEPRPTKLGAPPRPLGTLVHRARPPAYPSAQSAYVPPPPPPHAAPVQIGRASCRERV